MNEYEDAFGNFLGMKSLVLLHQNGYATDSQDDGDNNQSNKKSTYDVTDDESKDATTDRGGHPPNVATTKTHKFKRLLKPLE